MKILVLDNYDSFTYNLVHILRELNVDYDVYRNDKITVAEVAKYDAILLSPGPGIPSEAGNMPAIITSYATSKPILGICLGHQAIAEYFGGTLNNMNDVYHGVKSTVKIINKSILFNDIPTQFNAGRYHSWEVNTTGLPSALQVTAEDENGVIMAFQHTELPLYGLQFHPESIMTEYGKEMIHNFIELATKQTAK